MNMDDEAVPGLPGPGVEARRAGDDDLRSYAAAARYEPPRLVAALRLLDISRELVRMRAQASAAGDWARLVGPVRSAANAVGEPRLLETVEQFAAKPGPEAADPLITGTLRALLPCNSQQATSVACFTRDDGVARSLAGVLDLLWVGHATHTVARHALEALQERPPAIVIVDLGNAAEGMALIAGVTSDIALREVQIVACGSGEASERAAAIGLGATLYFSYGQLGSTLFRDAIGALLGIVEGAGLMVLEDPVSGLPPASRMRLELRTAVEDYALCRTDGWLLVGAHVDNALDRRAGEQRELIRFAVERLRAVCPDGAFLARLGDASLGVLVLLRGQVDAEMLEALSDPPPALEEQLSGALEAPVLRLAAVQGGIVSPREALNLLRTSLGEAKDAVLREARSIGTPRRGSVLLVEDDPIVARFVSAVLAGMGLAVVWRDNGMAGLNEIIAAPSAYAAVILDLHVPRLDGLQLLRVLGRAKTLGLPPVLVLTGSEEDSHQYRALEEGASDFVRKPVRPRVLAARVRALLKYQVGTSLDDVEPLGDPPDPV